MVDNEKVRLVAFEDRWHFVAIMCCKQQGIMEGELVERKLSVKLGIQLRELDEVKRRLMEVGLIDEHFNPTGWDEHQFKSDSSADRVRKHREKKADKALKTGDETQPESYSNDDVTLQERFSNALDTDTDTDTEEEKESIDAEAPRPSRSKKRKLAFSDVDMALAIKMDTNIKAITGSTKKTDIEKWANDFRIMRQIDGRSPEKMDNFLNLLATGDETMWEFWRGNILSPSSMRKNYDKVSAQYKRDVVDTSKISDPSISLSDRVAALARSKRHT